MAVRKKNEAEELLGTTKEARCARIAILTAGTGLP